MHVSLFVTCLADVYFADAVRDAVRVLESLDVRVDVPRGQTCCGQPPHNVGYVRAAADLAEHAIGVFGDADYVVMPSGSCAAMVRDYEHVIERAARSGGPRAHRLAQRTYELAEFLVDVLEVTELGRGLEGLDVAYHHGCHALRGLGVREAPLELLRSGGATVHPWVAEEECCGFGGLFSVKFPEVSVAMADRKLDTLPDDVVLTSADAGCLMHLGGRLGARDEKGRIVHLASLLWQAQQG